jgi:hypothetical protein
LHVRAGFTQEWLVNPMIMFDLGSSPVGLRLQFQNSGSEQPVARTAPGHEFPG